ncbi:MAG: YadA C-terminal domain-containing protein [Pseudomonadota bacterium]|nr:YadA C-terminal domain-containing protein [Pseudomonadota bacterium]
MTNAKLATDAVGTTNIQDNAVTTTKIQDGAISNQKLALNSVATGNIQNAAVTTDKIALGAVTHDRLAPAVQAMIADNSATIAQHDQRLNDLDAGVAMALALASVPVVPSKDVSLGLAVGSYNGQEGYAAKLNWVATTNLVVSGGVGANSRNEVSGAIGVSIGW